MKEKMRTWFNIEELQELLKNFYTVTKIRIVVFDDEFQSVAAYPTAHSTFCEVLRSDPKAREACRECDEEGCRISKKRKELYMYECYAGLVEVVVPLKVEDIIVGYLMLGQLILEDGTDRQKKWQELLKKVSGFHFDVTALEQSYKRKQWVTRETILAAAKIMETCASHLYLTRTVELRGEDEFKQIERYIKSNLRENITVDTLSEKFGIKRTSLYKMFDAHTGEGIAGYIRELRIRRARELLNSTDLKISDIAGEIGFPDYNNFTKIFKKETGMTPRDFRKSKKAQ